MHRGLAVGFVVLACGCATTHDLGRAADPATSTALEALAARSEVYAHVDSLPGTPSRLGDRVQKVTPDGVLVARSGDQPVLVPLGGVQSFSTYDHARGARTGALVGGIPALIVTGIVVGYAIYIGEKNLVADGGTALPHPKVLGPALTILGGLVGALVGGIVGGLSGHEDRYVIAPE